MTEIDPSMVVYLDETGIDNDEVYAHGWTPKGQELYAEKPGKKTQRISVIGSLNNNNFIAYDLYYKSSFNCDFDLLDSRKDFPLNAIIDIARLMSAILRMFFSLFIAS